MDRKIVELKKVLTEEVDRIEQEILKGLKEGRRSDVQIQRFYARVEAFEYILDHPLLQPEKN